MKVRWTSSSIRFRITPSELEALGSGQGVREELHLAGGSVAAAIVPDAVKNEVAMVAGSVEARLTPEAIAELLEGDREGVYFHDPGPPAVSFFVEKDFPCIHPRPIDAHEAPTETFVPPPDFAERKA